MPTATTLYQHRKRTKFWLSLAVAILVIGAMGFGVIRIVDKEVRSLVHSSLDATLATQVQVLEHWYDELIATAKGAVADRLKRVAPGLSGALIILVGYCIADSGLHHLNH